MATCPAMGSDTVTAPWIGGWSRPPLASSTALLTWCCLTHFTSWRRPDGVFAKVFENGIRCIAAPCPTLTEKGLNTGNTVIAAGTAHKQTDVVLEQMNYLVEGVIGKA